MVTMIQRRRAEVVSCGTLAVSLHICGSPSMHCGGFFIFYTHVVFLTLTTLADYLDVFSNINIAFLNLSVLCPGTCSEIPRVPSRVPHFLNYSLLHFYYLILLFLEPYRSPDNALSLPFTASCLTLASCLINKHLAGGVVTQESPHFLLL